MATSIAPGITARQPRSARSEVSAVTVVPPIAKGQEPRVAEIQRPAASLSTGEAGANRPVQQAKILVAADPELYGGPLLEQLKELGYAQLSRAADPEAGWKQIAAHAPDLVLLDILSDRFAGQELLRRIRFDPQTQSLPVLVLVSGGQSEAKSQAYSSGATDCVAWPLDPLEFAARVRSLATVRLQELRLLGWTDEIRRAVEQETAEMAATQQEIVQCLARAGEYRDHETGYHVLRVGRFAAAIARQLELPEPQVRLLEQAAQLHDVGKIGISDLILLKPGRLSPEEFALIKKHCEFGRDIIQPLRPSADRSSGTARCEVSRSPIMAMAARIAMTHHEWWNGAGYPRGLSGEEIPLEGRITAVADVFDALGSQRPYKPAFPSETCFRMMEPNRGVQFDPRVFDAFVAAREEILAIRKAIPDPPRSV